VGRRARRPAVSTYNAGMVRHAALAFALCFAFNAQESHADSYACQALSCSTLIPESRIDDRSTNDCGYRKGNQWWLDHVAGSLAWGGGRTPITVAMFDDGAHVEHEDLRDQLWTNAAEAAGKPGVDDDGNGFVDDLHGWDFVDNDATVAPQGECIGRRNHGTFMASLIAARRNNAAGIAAAGSDGARVMVTGCGFRGHRRRESWPCGHRRRQRSQQGRARSGLSGGVPPAAHRSRGADR
jgi:subtilisin family serine protease